MPEALRAESTMQLPMDGRRRVFSGAPTLRRQSVRVYKGCRVLFLKECEGLSWCFVRVRGYLRKYAATSVLPCAMALLSAVRPQLRQGEEM